MVRRFALFLSVLGLTGCGQEAQIVVVSNVDAASISIIEKPTEVEEAAIGLMDPSPADGDEIRGPMTYAFRPGVGEPKRGGVVRAALVGDIDTFNPFLSSSASASEVHEQIFPRLMSEQPDYYDGVPTFAPNIAESWVVSPDQMSIRFKLRDCKWSDGTPMSGHDVAFSVSAAKSADVAWVSASIVDFIKSVEVHSDRDFTVHYTRATPYNVMDINDVQIVPKHTFGTVPFGQWSGYGRWSELATKACGGPWVLDKHDAGEQISLKPNPEYWDKGKPYLDRLIFKIFAKMETVVLALEADELDIVSSIPPEQAGRILKDEDLLLYTFVARSYGYAGWNCKRFPFDDVRVRQAMTYAINRFDIVEGQFYGYAQVAAPNILRSIWASDRALQPYPYDPARASALLAEAGWKKNNDGILEKDGKPFIFKLTTNSGNPIRKAICERIEADLKKIGVRAEIRLLDFNLQSSKLKAHKFDAYVGGWYIATKVDPKPTFHSVSVNGRYNYVNYVDPYVDDLIDRGRVMNIDDPAIRREAHGVWKALQYKLYEDQPYTMIYEPRGLVGVSKRFVNVRVTALKWLDNVQDWWIE